MAAGSQGSLAQEEPDLIVNSGETYTMTPGAYEYNNITISPNAVLRTTGTVSVTASRMKPEGNILLGGSASFVLNYGVSNPGTEYTMEVGKLSSNNLIHCDFHLGAGADDGEPGETGSGAGDPGENGGNGSAGKGAHSRPSSFRATWCCGLYSPSTFPARTVATAAGEATGAGAAPSTCRRPISTGSPPTRRV